MSVVCRQCRARKVKCDRKSTGCSPCHRLRLACSLGRDNASLTPERTFPEDLTQAGIKRKRVRYACQPCKLVKGKCSGTYPCQRCQVKDLCCDLERHHAGYISNGSPTPSEPSLINGSHEDQVEFDPGKGLSGPQSLLPYDKDETHGHVDVYFRTASHSGMSLLHRPTILANWRQRTIDPALLKLIASIGMYESASASRSDTTILQARRCIQKVQDEALRHMGKQTIVQLNILVLLLRFRFDVGDFAEAWNLIAIAARLVFTMRLNHEHEGLDASTRETVRRLVWTVYEIDRKCCGGIDYLTVFPVDRMYIRLPCDESSFEMGLKSTLPYLKDKRGGQSSGLSGHSYKLKFLATRDRILKYTKRIRKSGRDLSVSRSEMESLQNELDDFKVDLPSEMELSTQKLGLMVHSGEGTRCIELHTMWLLSHCDLYRHCVPGIRESASYEALIQTPSRFIDHCQRACLGAAVKLCDLWSELYNLRPSESSGGGMMAIAIYQVAQILRHLPHLLTLDGYTEIKTSRHSPSIDLLQCQLLEAIELITPKDTTRFYPWAKCVRDAGKLVAALGRTERCRKNACYPSPSGVMSDMLDDENSQHDHLQSRHHMLAYITKDDKLSRESNNEQASGQSDGVEVQVTGRPTSPNVPVCRPYDLNTPPVSKNISDASMAYVPNHLPLADYGLEDPPPWDPFDMVFNDYHDSNVELFSPF